MLPSWFCSASSSLSLVHEVVIGNSPSFFLRSWGHFPCYKQCITDSDIISLSNRLDLQFVEARLFRVSPFHPVLPIVLVEYSHWRTGPAMHEKMRIKDEDKKIARYTFDHASAVGGVKKRLSEICCWIWRVIWSRENSHLDRHASGGGVKLEVI